MIAPEMFSPGRFVFHFYIMKIALTGASGRIGNVVARRLLDAGHHLRVLQRRDKPSLAGLPLERVSGHLLDRPSLEVLAGGCEALIHLAGLISVHGDLGGEVVRINVEGTRQVLEASLARGLRRVIVFSSVQAFVPPPAGQALDESAPLALQSPMAYNRAKAESLDLARRFATERPLEVLTLCPTGVLGPFDFEPSLSGQMLLDFHRGHIPMLTPGGADWVDVRDVADATLAALDGGQNGSVYLLGGRYASIGDLAATIGRVTGRRVPRLVAPEWLLRSSLPLMGAWARLSGTPARFTAEMLDTLRDHPKVVSTEKARQELGYSPRPLEETLADAFEWFKSAGYL